MTDADEFPPDASPSGETRGTIGEFGPTEVLGANDPLDEAVETD